MTDRLTTASHSASPTSAQSTSVQGAVGDPGADLESDTSVTLEADHQTIAAAIQALAQRCEGNPQELLAMLRMLEAQHREIQYGLFRESLPTNRQRLYGMLRDMESKGGWPYIPRMQLKVLLQWLEEEDS